MTNLLNHSARRIVQHRIFVSACRSPHSPATSVGVDGSVAFLDEHDVAAVRLPERPLPAISEW